MIPAKIYKMKNEKTQFSASSLTESLNILAREAFCIRETQNKFPTSDFITLKFKAGLKKQLDQLLDDIDEFKNDVLSSSTNRSGNQQGLIQNHWIETYQEQLFLWEQYHALFSWIQKLKSNTTSLIDEKMMN